MTLVGMGSVAHATSGTWNGSSDTTWATGGNWTTGTPGSTTVTNNGDTATFDSAPANAVPIVDLNRNLKFIAFTANAGALTLGTTDGNALLLTSGGNVSVAAAVTNAIAVNAPLSIYGSYTFTNASTTSTATLSIGGALTPATTSAVTLTLSGVNTGDNTFSGLISNGSSSALSLVKSSTQATGKWIISNSNNSFTGSVTITGVVSVPTIGNAGSNSALGQNGTINLGSGAGTSTLIYTGTGETSNKVINFGSTGTANSTIDLAAGSSGVLKFTANSTNAGTTKSIILQGEGSGGGVGGADGWFAGNLVEGSAGAGAKLAKNGTNTWTVSGTNTYTGGTTINGGKLVAGSYNALGTTAGSVTLAGGTTLGLATDVGIDAYNIGMANANSPTIEVGRGTSGSGDGISYTLGTLALGNGSTLSIIRGSNLTGGTPTINFGVTTLGATGGTSSTVSPVGVNVTLASVTNTTSSAKAVVLDGTSTGNFVSGNIGNGVAGGTVSVTKSNTGTWTLSSANGYTGTTTITGGTLIPSLSGSIGTGALSVNGAGAVLSMGATNQSVSGLTTLDGGGSITGSGTLTVSGNFTAKNGTVNVNLTGTGASTFTKLTGAGGNTVTLTGTNTYGGATTISDGTLALTGTATIAGTSYVQVNSTGTFDVSGLSSTFTLGSAQTLRGTGSVVGKVVGTGSITPNTAGAVGTLTFNDDVTIGGNLNIDVNGDTTGTADLIQGVHTLDISTATLTFANVSTLAAPLNDSAYVFASYGTLSGPFAAMNSLPSGYTIDYNYQGLNQIAIVAPEPSSLALFVLAAGGTLLRRRRA